MPSEMMETKELWDVVVKEPVSQDSPAGISVRFEPAFGEIQEEIQNLENPVSSGTVDWEKVIRIGEQILRKQSKDLLVASYVCVGLFQQQGLQGLVVGLRFYEGLVQQWWAQLFPEMKRMRGRLNAIVWLLEKLAVELEKFRLKSKDRENVEEVKKILEGFSSTVEGVLVPHAGDFPEEIREFQNKLSYIRGKLDKLGRELRDAEPPKASPSNQVSAPHTETPSSEMTKSSEKLESIRSEEEASRSLHQIGANIRQVLSYLCNLDSTNPLPYRMLRAVTWVKCESPVTDDSGKTRLAAPPPSLAKQLLALESQGTWRPLLEMADGKMCDFPYWLDLQRFASRAMQELGQEYERAKEAVLSELGHLLRRMPDLPRLEFASGMPLADAATRQWIEGEVTFRDTSQTGSKPQKEASASEQLLDAQQKVKALLRKKQEKEALRVLQNALRKSVQAHEQFHIRLEVVQACLEMKQWEVGVSQLEMLEQQINRHSLEEWDPETTLKASQLMWKILIHYPDIKNDDRIQLQKWAQAVGKRICRLDAAAGMSLQYLK